MSRPGGRGAIGRELGTSDSNLDYPPFAGDFRPLSGACFIGHKVSAVCREIVIMERTEPTYAPSFVLA